MGGDDLKEIINQMERKEAKKGRSKEWNDEEMVRLGKGKKNGLLVGSKNC